MKRSFSLAALVLIPFLCAAQKPLPPIPSESGLYTVIDGAVTRIEGQAISFHRTGSLLVSGVTAGIKTAKINVQIPGPHAQYFLDADPVFYYRPPPQAEAIGQAAGDLILVQLQVKHGRRQIEVGAHGILRGSRGISIRWQIQTDLKEVAPGVYSITPADDLKTGEYAFYIYRGEQLRPYLYPFSVESSGAEIKKKHKHRLHV